MRDLGSHLNVALRSVAPTLTSRLTKAAQVAVQVGTCGAPRPIAVRCVLAKVLPMGLYGVASSPIAQGAMRKLRGAI
eukprot:6339744-Alexandrium_andersonii.AAC.1